MRSNRAPNGRFCVASSCTRRTFDSPRRSSCAAIARSRCPWRSAATINPRPPAARASDLRFSARRSAQIKYAISGTNPQQQRNRLRRFVLNRDPSRAELRGARRASSADGKRVTQQCPGLHPQAGLFECLRTLLVAGLRRSACNSTAAPGCRLPAARSFAPRQNAPAIARPSTPDANAGWPTSRPRRYPATGISRPAISILRKRAAEPHSRAAPRRLCGPSSPVRRTRSRPPTLEPFAGIAAGTRPAAARAPQAGRAARPAFSRWRSSRKSSSSRWRNTPSVSSVARAASAVFTFAPSSACRRSLA